MLDLCHDSAKFIRAWLYSRCSIGCLNAVEPGTKVEIHRHPTKDESFVLLRGRVRVNTYNDDGTVLESIVLCPEDGLYGVDIPKNVWHKLESLEPGSVFFECKEGPFVPHEEEGVLQLQESL
jgi:cupin fold WbuC family metalloprotein